MRQINNQFYHELNYQWYHWQVHLLAFLRQENKLRNPYLWGRFFFRESKDSSAF